LVNLVIAVYREVWVVVHEPVVVALR
jgi:hypothetical protein